MNQNFKEEFKGCAVTGLLGFLLGVSIIGGAYYMTNDLKTSCADKADKPQPISSHKTVPSILTKQEKQR